MCVREREHINNTFNALGASIGLVAFYCSKYVSVYTIV